MAVELDAYMSELFENAKKAQAVIATYNQEQVDVLVTAIAKTIHDHAAELAELAVEITKMGNVADKTAKNKNKSRHIAWDLKGKKSVDIIEYDDAEGIVKVAKPIGIVGAITPVTNPIVTPMSNAMFALKGRIAIIISAHHSATECSKKAIEYMRAALKENGAPEDLIQLVDDHSRIHTQMLISNADIAIATGGAGMVTATYSSGRPALGVGAGNVQAIVDDDVDIKDAINKIITGRGFDYGIICTGEQSMFVPESKYEEVKEAIAAAEVGAYLVPKAENDKMRDAMFPGGAMNKKIVGKSAKHVAEAAGINIPECKVLVVEADDMADILGKEKMFPVITLYKYKTWEEAVEKAYTNLMREGAGHSIALHSNNKEHVEYAAVKCPVSRIVVNQVCASSGGGAFHNGLHGTNTLGCGTWGGNSISENLTYYHLINVARIAYNMADKKAVPTDEQIWA